MPARHRHGHIAARDVQTQDIAGDRHQSEEPEQGRGDNLVLLGPVPQEAAVLGTVQAQHEHLVECLVID